MTQVARFYVQMSPHFLTPKFYDDKASATKLGVHLIKTKFIGNAPDIPHLTQI